MVKTPHRMVTIALPLFVLQCGGGGKEEAQVVLLQSCSSLSNQSTLRYDPRTRLGCSPAFWPPGDSRMCFFLKMNQHAVATLPRLWKSCFQAEKGNCSPLLLSEASHRWWFNVEQRRFAVNETTPGFNITRGMRRLLFPTVKQDPVRRPC